MTTNEEIFAERLKSVLDGRGLLRSQFADLIGYDRQSVYKWTQGQRLPSGLALVVICTTLELSADWLLGLSDE